MAAQEIIEAPPSLTQREQRRKAKLEAVVDRGQRSFVEVGQALAELRGPPDTPYNERLYRQDADTFEQYVEQRWGFSPQHGGRLIAAAEVVGSLEPIGSKTSPASEAVARELAPLKGDPDRLAQAWELAVQEAGAKPLTAKQVKAVVDRVKPKSKRLPRQSQAQRERQALVTYGKQLKAITKLAAKAEQRYDDVDFDDAVLTRRQEMRESIRDAIAHLEALLERMGEDE